MLEDLAAVTAESLLAVDMHRGSPWQSSLTILTLLSA